MSFSQSEKPIQSTSTSSSNSNRDEAIKQLQEEFGEDVLAEYDIYYHGSSTNTPISRENLRSGKIFTSPLIETAEFFARRKVSNVGGKPEITAILIEKGKVDALMKQPKPPVKIGKAEGTQMKDKVEIVFDSEVLREESDFFLLKDLF